jgi:hypothetical protein
MTTWTSSTLTTSTSVALPVNWTVAPLTYPVTYKSPAEPEPERPLAWLDREIERTCALARPS